MLAGADRRCHQFPGNRGAADQFDQHIHFRVGDQCENVPAHPHTIEVAGRVVATDADMDNFQRGLGPRRDGLGVLPQQIESAAADSAEAADTYSYRLHVAIPCLCLGGGHGFRRVRHCGTCA